MSRRPSRISHFSSISSSAVLDSASVRTIDELPLARTSVSSADKLWTQIDVLDDVRRMAAEVKRDGSFFTSEFDRQVDELKQRQQKLLEVMSTQHDATERARILRFLEAKESKKSGGLNEAQIRHELEVTKQRMHDFFFGETQEEQHAQLRTFAELDEHVGNIKELLDELAETMEKFEAVVKRR